MLSVLLLLSQIATAQGVELVAAPSEIPTETLRVTVEGRSFVKTVFGDDNETLAQGWSEVDLANVHHQVSDADLRRLGLISQQMQRQFDAAHFRLEAANPHRNIHGLSLDEYRLFKLLLSDKRVPRVHKSFLNYGEYNIVGMPHESTRDWSRVAEAPAFLNAKGEKLYSSMIQKIEEYYRKENEERDRRYAEEQRKTHERTADLVE